MLARWRFLGAVLAGVAVGATLSGPASAGAGDCAPARLADEAVTLPRAWRRALEALVAATAREGQPWSCPDARITLIPPGDRGLAQLEIEDASGVRRRPVASPADVVPLGEAMLARTYTIDLPPSRPVAMGDPQRVPQTPPSHPPIDETAPHAGGRAGGGPRTPGPAGRGTDLRIDLLAGARYTGPTQAVLVGPELRVTLGFDRWVAGLVARYDTAVAFVQPVPDQFSLSSVTVGLAGAYRLLNAPVELTLAVEPTMAVVVMGAQRPDTSEPDVDSRVDMRLGASFAVAIPVGERVRVACAIVGEGVPAALFGDRHSRRHELPSMPGYLAGLSVGMELLAIR